VATLVWSEQLEEFVTVPDTDDERILLVEWVFDPENPLGGFAMNSQIKGERQPKDTSETPSEQD
jgi:hypothetical protein